MSFFNLLYSILGYPLGWIMWAVFKVVPNYLVSLLLFTLIVKLMMLPLSIKQQKSTAQMALYQPRIKEIQAKYANNRVKMNEEMQKFYEEEHYNPSSGCLPILITFPILFGLIDVVYKPLTHLLRLSSAVIADMTTIASGAGLLSEAAGSSTLMSQIFVYDAVRSNPSLFSSIAPDIIEKIQALDMSFMGINLAQKSSWAWPLILIPILSGVTALLSSLVTMKVQSAATGNNASNMTMIILMPLMSLWFTTFVSAGVGIYWIFNNLLSGVQSVILNKFYNPKDLLEQVKAQKEAQKEADKQRRQQAHERARQRAINSGVAGAEALSPEDMSEKELNRLKIAEARRRMAERYGDDYADVTDADLK